MNVHAITRPRTVLTVAAAAAAALVLLTPAADAAVRFKIRGAGWGHGVGMSQWGAQGYAKHGRDHKWILEHYYRHTRIGHAASRQVKVLLMGGVGSVRFSSASRACGKELDPGRDYKADREGSDVILRTGAGERLANCGNKLKASGASAIEVEGKGSYRGKLLARISSAGGLNVINSIGLESYVKGVVANEMPSSWHRQALRAQAIAARSYALAAGVNGEGFDLYDDTRSQIYRGQSSETPPTNRAVKQTNREVVKHEGGVATTFYFSTSGGETENVEYGFVGVDPKPYLKGVKDRFDGAAPYHRWKVTYSRHEMEDRLGSLVKGNLQGIEVTKRGRSPRIVEAKVRGTGGDTTVTGPTLQARLGLRSTWAHFKKIRG